MTYQLEQAHIQLREAHDQKEAFMNEMNQHRNLTYTLEAGREEV